MTSLQAATPADLGALRSMIAAASEPVCYIAGGTDLLVTPREVPRAGWIIDISRTHGLSGIALAGGALRIGATTTLAALVASPLVQRHVPALAGAADVCGSMQIRNRATLGGNVANASPASDLLPVLKCLDASFLVLRRAGGEDLRSFDALLGPSVRTPLAPGDLIVRIDIPLLPDRTRSAFVKLGRREDLTISRLNLAMVAEMDSDGVQFGQVRLVAGAIAPRPLLLDSAARALAGKALSAATAEAYLEALAAAVDGAIPGRASRGYKRRAVMGLGLDLLERITGRSDLLP